ncbi:MAG: AAA family ATPase [Kiritimatiellae bacterium]|jgi:general secretion pathway protein A|nr:AAA family ATPase [Kiritimatiellia bacterium]
MYLKYWNLNEEPFRQIATDRMVFMSMQYREGLARLFYLFDQKRTAGMITGPYGVGKTLTFEFLRRRALRDKAQVIQIDAIPNGSLPMARHILRCLGLPDAASTLAEALMTLQVHARQSAPRLKHTLLLVDEAQQLVEGDGFYLVHYLCNLRIGEGGEDPLFTTIIAGTDLLREAMKAQDSLRRRIQLDWRLNPLSERETVEYVQHHIAIAGGDIWIFTNEALAAVYTYSRGIPRSINNVCDTALMLGYAAQARVVDNRIVAQAAHDTGLDTLMA